MLNRSLCQEAVFVIERWWKDDVLSHQPAYWRTCGLPMERLAFVTYLLTLTDKELKQRETDNEVDFVDIFGRNVSISAFRSSAELVSFIKYNGNSDYSHPKMRRR